MFAGKGKLITSPCVIFFIVELVPLRACSMVRRIAGVRSQ
jgi:hypothetical protein